MRLGSPLPSLVALGVAVAVTASAAVPGASASTPAVALAVPTAAPAGPGSPNHGSSIAPKTAKKPTKKKPAKGKPKRKSSKKQRSRKGRSAKKQEKTTGVVNASWSVKRSGELRNGVESETITVTVKDGKVTFPDETGRTATGKGDVTILYEAKFVTDDRSWHAGCDREERTSTATFHESHPVYVYATNRRRIAGKEQRIANGWGVEVALPEIRKMGLVTTGFFQDWETILMENCLTTPIDQPLGHWGPQFVSTLGATGSLNGGGKGVLLTQAQSDAEQTAQADGRISFSASVEKR